MKKSLIALAVLAASGASFAQSSVSVYGKLDLWLGKSATTGAPTQTVLNDGGVGGSRFGFKGSEDLGGGLKANFLLEQGFDTSTGTATAGQAFSRYSYVGFSGGFGEVRLGKVGTAYDDINGNSHELFDSNVGSYINVWAPYTATAANSIYYASNTYSGFSGAVSYGLGENKTNAATPVTGQVGDGSASNIASLHVKYAAGPLYVGMGYQKETPQGGGDSYKNTRLNASYDLGVVKLLADVGRASQGDAAANQWTLGVDVPVTSALTVSGGYSKSSDNTAAGDDVRKGYVIGAAYTLSKRTLVYVAYHNDTTTPTVGDDTKNKIAAVGVQHNF